MDNYEKAERLVRNEVYVCLSSLVSTLAQDMGSGRYATPKRMIDGLADLVEQAFELASPVLDYEEAARSAGWSVSDNGERFINVNGASPFDGPSPGNESAWQQLCEEHDIDPYEWDVFEHWAVSEHLADDLIAVGEKVDKDFAGMCVWARTTTGQGIAMDSCIARVLALGEARLAGILAESAA